MKTMIGIVILILIVGGYYYFGRSSYAPTSPAEKAPASTESTAPATPVSPTEEGGPSGETAREIKVEMVGLKFVPPTVKIKAGEKVKLLLTSDVTHTYTIDKLGLNFRLQSGEAKSFDLMVEKPGTYEVYCATPGHKEGGMVGRLIVE